MLIILPKAEKKHLYNQETLELLKKKSLQSHEMSQEYIDFMEQRIKIITSILDAEFQRRNVKDAPDP